MTKKETKELGELTRTKLVEEAKKYDGIVGASGMKKEELVEAIEAERSQPGEENAELPKGDAPAAKAKVRKKGPSRDELKSLLAVLKGKRQEALEAGDKVQLKRIRTRYKKVNRMFRRTVPAKA